MKRIDERKERVLKQKKRICDAYNNIKRTCPNEWKIVFFDILQTLKFYDLTSSKEHDIILQNAAKKIMEHAGIWTVENAEKITDALLKIEAPVIKE